MIKEDKGFTFLDVDAVKRKAAREKAEAEEIRAEVEFGDIKKNPYLPKSKIYEITHPDTADPEKLRQMREYEEKARIRRKKTNKHVGSFWWNLLGAITFSPSKTKAEWKKFQAFCDLGKFSLDPDYKGPSEEECEELYRQKMEILFESFTSISFLKSAIKQIAIFIIAPGLALRFTIPLSGIKHPVWSLISFVMFMVCWNSIKIFLKKVIGIMKSTRDTVLAEKAKEDKRRAAAAEEQRKSEQTRKKADKARKKAKEAEELAKNPTKNFAPPSGRGRYAKPTTDTDNNTATEDSGT